ncbi:MAG: LysM peptidoglycan-binding domain-containing protein [Bacteroidota bacterium]
MTVQKEEPKPVIAKQKVARWVRHVVKKGETLWDISKRYDTKVEVIKMSNKLETDSISSGQILRVFTNVKTE